ncbi:hypothetical protein [Lysinibacillus sp. NPDC047702]|uniref:hypothetical protein n=1 Tax=unclassified Lysinibacillus TaxID=2636778 RepID=UPI003CFF33F4
MSNDLILGSLAGVLFSAIIGLGINAILKFDFKRLKFTRGIDFFFEILINLFINSVILLSVSDQLRDFKFLAYITVIAVVYLSSYVAHLTFAKKKDWVEKLLTSVSANVGMFAFVMGLFCVIEGWKKADEMLSYGSVLIAIGSFAMMFFIAFLQFIDSKQKDKSVKN